jgi:rubrerythrin
MEVYQFVNGCLVIENAVASLYSNFMQLFPEEKDFWEDLYNDEQEHASFLMEAADQGLFDEIKKEDLPLSMPLLDRTRKFVETTMNQIKFNPLSLEEAFKIALKFEETLVETFTNYLIANLSDNKEAILEMFADERSHIDKIKEMMIKKGFSRLS